MAVDCLVGAAERFAGGVLNDDLCLVAVRSRLAKRVTEAGGGAPRQETPAGRRAGARASPAVSVRRPRPDGYRRGMRANEITRERLRRLADLRPPSGKVLSLYLNLDPSQFGTAPARSTEVNSVINHAEAASSSDDERLTHDERAALRADLERVRGFLGNGLDASGARPSRCSAPARPTCSRSSSCPSRSQQDAIVDDVPHLEPLARFGLEASWCVILVSRRTGRILVGTRHELRELRRIEANPPRLDNSDTFVARDDGLESHAIALHVKQVSEAALHHLMSDGFDCVLVAAAQDLVHEVERRLHPEVAKRIVGRIDVEIERSTPEAVLEAATAQMDLHVRRRQDDGLSRLSERLATGGAAAAGPRRRPGGGQRAPARDAVPGVRAATR